MIKATVLLNNTGTVNITIIMPSKLARKKQQDSKKWLQWKENKQQVSIKSKLSENYAVNREKVDSRQSAYNARNREVIKSKQAAYDARNREVKRAKQGVYDARNRDVKRAKQSAYDTRNRKVKRAKQGSYDAANRIAVNDKQRAYDAKHKQLKKISDAERCLRKQTRSIKRTRPTTGMGYSQGRKCEFARRKAILARLRVKLETSRIVERLMQFIDTEEVKTADDVETKRLELKSLVEKAFRLRDAAITCFFTDSRRFQSETEAVRFELSSISPTEFTVDSFLSAISGSKMHTPYSECYFYERAYECYSDNPSTMQIDENGIVWNMVTEGEYIYPAQEKGYTD